MTLPVEAERLIAEVFAAATRVEAECLVRDFDFRPLSAEQCEELCARLGDVVNELKEGDETTKQKGEPT
jgi:hypothetical protein